MRKCGDSGRKTDSIKKQRRIPSSEEDDIIGLEKVDKKEGGKDAVRDELGVDD